MIDWIKDHWKTILLIVIIITLLFYLYDTIQAQKKLQEDLHRATQMTEEQATDIEYLQKELEMNKQNAKETVTIIEKAQSNQIPPTTTITVQAPSLPEAVQQTTERIQEQDPTLPKEALEDTDHTIVAPQPENKDYQVGVYKINTYRDWAVGTGVGVNDDDIYVPVVVSRQYEKDKSIDLQINLDPEDNMKPNGVQLVHKWHF